MTISVLQVTTGVSSTASSSTVAETATFTAASRLLVAIVCATSTTVSLASSRGETFTNVLQISQAGDSRFYNYLISDAGMVGGSTVLTNTFGAATTARGIFSVEIGDSSGYDTGSKASNNQGTPGTGTDAVTSTNMPALSAQPALIVGITANTEGDTPASAGTGFTNGGSRINYAGAIPDMFRVESKRVTVTSAAAATFTAAVNSRHLSIAIAFLENGAAGGGATRGTPFGHVGTAFNGGRPLHGIIN